MTDSMQITVPGKIPTRFEDEFSEEAEVLMKLCASQKLREVVQATEEKYPKKDRIYDCINPLKSYMENLIHGGGSKIPYKRAVPKTKRNEPCPCGSGKKFKKCCLNT